TPQPSGYTFPPRKRVVPRKFPHSLLSRGTRMWRRLSSRLRTAPLDRRGHQCDRASSSTCPANQSATAKSRPDLVQTQDQHPHCWCPTAVAVPAPARRRQATDRPQQSEAAAPVAWRAIAAAPETPRQPSRLRLDFLSDREIRG